MDLSALKPLSYYAAASILTILCLKQCWTVRLLSLAPVLSLSFLSLVSSKHLVWPMGVETTFASLVVFYMPYSIKLLAFDELPCNPEVTNQEWSFVDCYRLWNNPRDLHLQYKPRPSHQQSRVIFTLRRSLIAATLWALNSNAFERATFVALKYMRPSYFSHSKEFWSLSVSRHEFIFRTYISLHWIWTAYFFLEFFHCLLSIIFVSLVRFDKPWEWPSLFRSPLEAYSVRGFWGRFWHRLTIPTYTSYARLFSRKVIGARSGSRLEKTLIPMFIFTLSGLSHSLVAWALGHGALMSDLLFFEINFIAAAAETAITKMGKSRPATGPWAPMPSPLRRLIGVAALLMFFYSVAPIWFYPKMRNALAQWVT